MPKITDYPNTTTVDPQDLLLVDGVNGTKTIKIKDFEAQISPEVLSTFSPEMHRIIYRGGENLGDTVNGEQLAAIQNGSFEGMFVGDYWLINDVKWRIVDIDYWMNCGDTAFTEHHLVIMPDAPLYSAQMNATNITTGGYVSSTMRTVHLNTAKTQINSAFPGLVKTKRSYLINGVTNGYPAAGAWMDSDIDLPSEVNMYGSNVFTPGSSGTVTPARYSIDKQQFALFMIKPEMIMGDPRSSNWLRDVVSAAHFAFVTYLGHANAAGASNSRGVRPCFAIG